MLNAIKRDFGLEAFELSLVNGHEGGRNQVYICCKDDIKRVLRISYLSDRTLENYVAETEFVRYLNENGAPVAGVFSSVNGKRVEQYESDGKKVHASLFDYAKGMLISDNGYRYREGAPLEEYFVNTGKALGKIHRLSKEYGREKRRADYFDVYNKTRIHALMGEKYEKLKTAIFRRLDEFRALCMDKDSYGLVHFDFSDGNYHIDMSNGDITVYDFDNCINAWYMFDLANLWTHGVGWFQFEPDADKRMSLMAWYFEKILEGYRMETTVSDGLLEKLPLFIDMVLIENIVDEFECCLREGEEVDDEDIEDAAMCLIHDVPYAGFGE